MSAKSSSSYYFFDRWTIDGATAGASSSVQVVMNSPHVALAYFDGATWATYNLSGSRQRDFYVNDTVQIGALVTQGTYTVTRVVVTILSPSNIVLVANASMAPVIGNANFNYAYNYQFVNNSPGTYNYNIFVTWSSGKTIKTSEVFNLINVTTSASGPASIVRGTSYAISFLVADAGHEAHNIILYVDLPQGQAVTSVTLGGAAKTFSSAPSPLQGYTRYSVNVGYLATGGSAQVAMTISVSSTAPVGQTTIYYHTTWTTFQGFAYAESLKLLNEIVS